MLELHKRISYFGGDQPSYCYTEADGWHLHSGRLPNKKDGGGGVLLVPSRG